MPGKYEYLEILDIIDQCSEFTGFLFFGFWERDLGRFKKHFCQDINFYLWILVPIREKMNHEFFQNFWATGNWWKLEFDLCHLLIKIFFEHFQNVLSQGKIGIN